jgi:hypothetical protein
MVEYQISTDPNDLVWDYTYVWINDGSWQSGSSTERALQQAADQAYRAGINVHAAPRVVIDSLDCTVGHVNLCAHLRVRFYARRLP